MILVGDIGGTNTRLALFEKGKIVGEKRKFPSSKYKNLQEIIHEFLFDKKIQIEKACFAVAGPVLAGVCKATNLPWIVDASQISKSLSIPSVFVINDLEANAYGIKVLKKEEFVLLQMGKEQKGNQALISAGTGLGEAGIYWDGKEHHPFACEGGHVDFGPRNADEVELFTYLKKHFSHVSYERIVSGPGLYLIFEFLVKTGKEVFSSAVKAEMERRDHSKVISEFAVQKRDKACMRAVEWFISLYGAEAGNLALKFFAVGGVYIGGGIAPHLIDLLKSGDFVSAFCSKGRFNILLETIPIRVIMNEDTALLGAASFGERNQLQSCFVRG